MEQSNICNYIEVTKEHFNKNDLELSLKYLKKVLLLDRYNKEALGILIPLLLKSKNYEDGFFMYNYRHYFIEDNTSINLDKKYHLKKGSDIKDKTLFIYHEQGFGDMIQFIRFLSFFHEAKAEIIVYIPEVLERLFSYNYSFAKFISKKGESKCDYHFSLLDSAYLLNLKYNNIPYNKQYLRVKKEDSLRFYDSYFKDEKKVKIGIVWKTTTVNNSRSIDLEKFLEFLDFKDVKLYSFVLDLTKKEKKLIESSNIISFQNIITDFYDTASLVDNLDLVVSIDTSILHLSAAMNKPTFILVPFLNDWRWGIDTENTNWYESIKIFRQKKENIWDEALDEMRSYIKDFVKNYN